MDETLYNLLTKGFLLRQIYNWAKDTLRIPLQDFKTFRVHLKRGDYEKVVESLATPIETELKHWFEKSGSDIKPLENWGRSQELLAVALFAAIFISEAHSLQRQLKQDSTAPTPMPKIKIEFGVLLGSCMCRQLFPPSQSTQLNLVIEFLSFLKDSHFDSPPSTLVHAFEFLQTKLKVKSAAKLHDLMAKAQASKGREFKVQGARTLQNLIKGKRIELKTLQELAGAISDRKDTQVQLTIIFIIAHAIQYYFHQEENQTKAYPLNEIPVLQTLWSIASILQNDGKGASAFTQEALKHTNQPKEAIDAWAAFATQLLDPATKTGVWLEFPYFPCLSQDIGKRFEILLPRMLGIAYFSDQHFKQDLIKLLSPGLDVNASSNAASY